MFGLVYVHRISHGNTSITCYVFVNLFTITCIGLLQQFSPTPRFHNNSFFFGKRNIPQEKPRREESGADLGELSRYGTYGPRYLEVVIGVSQVNYV
jgi:hypothetical protein